MPGIVLSGYICKTDVPSRPIFYKDGFGNAFREVIESGVFRRALRYTKPTLTINHDRVIAIMPPLELEEDAIGLKFRAEILDPEVIKYMSENKIKGCSFTFKSMKETSKKVNGEEVRIIQDMKLYEVSLTTSNPIHASSVICEEPIINDDQSPKVKYVNMIYQLKIDQLRLEQLEMSMKL